MATFHWGAVLLPAVQKAQDFHFNALAQDFHRAGATMQDFHFKAVAQDFHFKAIAQDFHRTMSVPDGPELALPAVQADAPDL